MISILLPPIFKRKFWADIEDDIQARAKKKDADFHLEGKWKKYYKEVDGFLVYKVNGEWVRNNLSVIFGHGGHGYVHEFIPTREIWVATKHWPYCGCHRWGGRMTAVDIRKTIRHEIEEFKLMKEGWKFIKAHREADRREEQKSC